MRLSILTPLALAGFLAGCQLFVSEDLDLVLDETEVYSVTPANGVWDEEYGRTSDPKNCSFSFKITRTVGGLIVTALVQDNAVVTDDSPYGPSSEKNAARKPWDDDTFQCFFDGDLDGAPDSHAVKGRIWGGEYALAANGVAQSDWSSCPNGFGQHWGGRVFVTKNAANDYLLDYRLFFSWACLGLPKPPAETEDVTFGFNACVHDDDDGGRADRALYWKGSPTMPYSNESLFGRITLKGRKVE